VGGQRRGGEGDHTALSGDLLQAAGDHAFSSSAHRSAPLQEGRGAGGLGVEGQQSLGSAQHGQEETQYLPVDLPAADQTDGRVVFPESQMAGGQGHTGSGPLGADP